MKLAWRNFHLDFLKKTHVMGVLNITPDSFSDGGLHFDKSKAVDHALRMAEDGADIIDIGGESTRPGSYRVGVEEELERTLPVIETLAKKLRIPISIDTYKSDVARRALDAGVAIVNDISGMRFDPDMPKVVAKYAVPVVLMHIKGNPYNMQVNPVYRALIPEIVEYLETSIRNALESGIRSDMIIVDPGIGFGKTFNHNLTILNHLEDFSALGKPLLVGPSRKAFIGKLLGAVPPNKRVEGTAAAVAISIMKGANIIRVHDVKEMVKVAIVADAIRRDSIPDSSSKHGHH